MNTEVKRAFVLADRMKAAQHCENEAEFRSLLDRERQCASALEERELCQIVGRDESRLNRFEKSEWTLDEIVVADCFVWDGMGSRPWAVGSVKEVGERFLQMEPAGSRVWKMKRFARLFSAHLPLITFCRDGRLTIDDGSHRAVAMHLAGVKKAKAFVGVPKKNA